MNKEPLCKLNITALVWVYAIFSFVNWDYNPANWESWVRVFFFIVWFAWEVLIYSYQKEKAILRKAQENG